MATERLKRHNSPGFDQIPAEWIKAGGRTFRSEIYKLVNSIKYMVGLQSKHNYLYY